MREVGDVALDRVQFGGDGVEFRLQGLGLFPKLPPLLLPRFPLGGVFSLADRLGDLVRVAIALLDFDLFGFALRFELYEAVHVNFHAAVCAVLLDEFGVFENESAIEHGGKRGQGSGARGQKLCRLRLRTDSAVGVISPFFVHLFLLRSHFAQFFPQPDTGLDAAMEVGQGELLVGTVRVVVVLPPA